VWGVKIKPGGAPPPRILKKSIRVETKNSARFKKNVIYIFFSNRFYSNIYTHINHYVYPSDI